VNEHELKCMAQNIYFEGRAEPMMGKIAIGHVVMNRMEDKERSYSGKEGQNLLSNQAQMPIQLVV